QRPVVRLPAAWRDDPAALPAGAAARRRTVLGGGRDARLLAVAAGALLPALHAARYDHALLGTSQPRLLARRLGSVEPHCIERAVLRHRAAYEGDGNLPAAAHALYRLAAARQHQ